MLDSRYNLLGEKRRRKNMLEKVFASNGDILVGSEFNFPMINILWQIVAGTRYESSMQQPHN